MGFRLSYSVLLVSAALFAQSERGNITGVVTDSSGAVVPNVSVTITNTATNVPERVVTTSAGEYNAANLVPGLYRIEVSASGFKRFSVAGVTLTAGSTARADARLEIGAVGESVQVQASAVQLQTENSKVSTAVQSVMVDELPLVVGGAMRSPYDLVATAAESKGSGTTLSLGGGEAASWSATLDGLLVNTNRSSDAGETSYLAPSVESITEFAVDTNGFKAEFGQAGGGVITFVSKSGTNDFHGVAYDFLRNDDFDARGFFAPTRSIYKQNDFGATAGGPVWIPKVYNGRNKTFFFLAYEGFRNRIGQNGSILSVPTPEMYQGDFSKLVSSTGAPILIYDPSTTQPNASGNGFTRQPFPNNQIPQSLFSTITKQMLALAPQVAPNRPGLVPGSPNWVRNNYVVNNGSTTSPTNKGSLKLDQNFGYNHHIAFFYNRSNYISEPGPSGPPGLPLPLWNGQFTSYDASDYRMTYDWTISPRLLSHFSIGGNKFYKDAYSPNVGKNWKSKVCIPNAVDCNTNYPNVTFTEFTGWGATADNGTEQPMWAIREDLSFIRGAHTMKFGYDFQSPHAAGFGQQNISGNAGFSFLETAVPGATSASSGSSFASYLLGAADTGATETIRYLPQIYDYHAAYAQDDWRVTKRLTLNFGLRYELTRPPYQPSSGIRGLLADAAEPGGERLSRRSGVCRLWPRPGRSEVPGARLVRRLGTAPRAGVWSQLENHDPRRRCAHLLPFHGGFGHHPLRWLHRSVRLRLHQSGRDAGIQLGRWPAFLSAAAPTQPGVRQQQQHQLLEWSERHAHARDPGVHFLHPAPALDQHPDRGRLQRHRRRAPADRAAQHQPGSDAGGELAYLAARTRGNGQSSEFERNLGRRPGRRNQDSVREFHQPGRAAHHERGAGAAALSAISDHRYQPERRQERPLHL